MRTPGGHASVGPETSADRSSVLRRATAPLALAVLVTAVGVLFGWHAGIPVLTSIVPGYITMKANTAIAFVLVAGAVLLLRREPVARARRVAAAALLLVVAAIAAITLAEYLLDRNLGIDELVYPDPGAGGRFPPGRLAPITAVDFLLLCAALGLSHLRRRPTFRAAHVMVLLAFLTAFQALVGYLLGTTYTFGSAFYTQMALHTTVLFVLASLAVLASRPDRGLVAVLTSATAGGVVARNLVGWAIVAPPLVGWIALLGERVGLYDANFTTLLRVVANSVFFTVLVWRNAASLHALDLKRAQAERAREAQYAQAQRALAARDQAIRARDEFLTLASHELRTPLTPLRLRVQQLRRAVRGDGGSGVPPEVVLDLTAQFDRHITRLSMLVESLLEASRLSGGDLALEREEVPLRAIVSEALGRASDALVRAGCSVEADVPADLAILADAPRVVHALALVLDNAAKHAGGSLVVVRARRTAGAIRIEVEDRGPGVPAEAQERIFRRFERSAAEGLPASGLGLGLYLARQIVRAHGGDLTLRSAPGAGATFVLELPPPAAAARDAGAGASADGP